MENIGGDAIDIYYRYKMPKMVLTHRKNQTDIDNLPLVAKSLNRPLDELLKYFAQNLGTHSNPKTNLLSGTYQYTQLHDLLLKYIDDFVLCEQCGNPETDYAIKKSHLYRNCRACSGLIRIKSDSKLVKFVLQRIMG